MNGLINVLKPTGMTSHDVVSFIRRLLQTKKVGHAGTLDPGAAGVLPVCVGQATRLVEYMTEWTKAYRAELVLGVTTDTQDDQGQVLSEVAVDGLTEDRVAEVMQSFLGQIAQLPPMMSALKHQGRRLYDLAREGKTVERRPRTIQVYQLELLRFRPGPRPSVLFDVTCSKGTYVRALCADIGHKLGCGGHMSFLVRTAVGPFPISEAWTLEELADDAGQTCLLPMQLAVADLPTLVIKSSALPQLRHGQTLPAGDFIEIETKDQAKTFKTITPDGDLVALGRVESFPPAGWCFKPGKVLVAET